MLVEPGLEEHPVTDAHHDARSEFSHGRHAKPEPLAAGPQPAPTPRIEIHSAGDPSGT